LTISASRPKKRHAMPFRQLLHLAGRLVLETIGGRKTDVGHGVAARQITGFRIGSEIPDENDLVDGCHDFSC
jgi:hypothetical protein